MLRRNPSLRRRLAQLGNRLLPPISKQTYFYLAVTAGFSLTMLASLLYVIPRDTTITDSHGFAAAEIQRAQPVAVSSAKAKAKVSNEVGLKHQPMWLYPADHEVGQDDRES